MISVTISPPPGYPPAVAPLAVGEPGLAPGSVELLPAITVPTSAPEAQEVELTSSKPEGLQLWFTSPHCVLLATTC